MVDFFTHYRRYFLIGIIIMAAFLIFPGLDAADVQTDEAIYSLRGIGYFDFVDSNLQLTPISWFEEIPSWSRLSFHDSPPLVFLIQYLFFKIFGISVFAVRLPFALASLGSVILTYFIGQRLHSAMAGLLASFLLVVSTYFIWASRIGYLEPIALFFVLLALLWFLKGLDQSRHFLLFGVFLGLMMLTKYTTFFILPALALYLFFKQKKLFLNREFIIGLVIAALLFAPIIFYNIMLFQTRGHFDLQIAQLLQQDTSQDWPIITGSSVSFDWRNIVAVFTEPKLLHSLPFYGLLLAGVFYIFIAARRRLKLQRYALLALLLIFAVVEFSLIGASLRFLSLLLPLFALSAGIFLLDIFKYFATIHQRWYRLVGGGLLVLLLLVAGFEIFYNINTNHLAESVGVAGKHYSTQRWQDNGAFNQLEDYLLSENPAWPGLQPRIIRTKADLVVDLSQTAGQDIFVFDPNLRWFSSLWYFRRWAIYHHLVFISAADLGMVIPDVAWDEYFQRSGARSLYFIWGKNSDLFDSAVADTQNLQASANLASVMLEKGALAQDIIDRQGQVAFTLLKLSLNN